MYNCLMRLKLMIVDDDPFELDLLKNLILECGEEPFPLSTPEEALELVRKHRGSPNRVDAAFIDLLMPGMDGLTLHRQLKELDSALEVYILSADNSLEIRKKVASIRDIEGFISKSNDIEEIKRYISIAKSNKKRRLNGEKSPF